MKRRSRFLVSFIPAFIMWMICSLYLTGQDSRVISITPESFSSWTGEGDALLRETITNEYSSLITERWFTPDLIGKEVYLEIFSSALEALIAYARQYIQ